MIADILATPGAHLVALCLNIYAAYYGGLLAVASTLLVGAFSFALWFRTNDAAVIIAAKIVEKEQEARRRRRRVREKQYWE